MKLNARKRMLGFGLVAIVLAVALVIGLLPGAAIAAGLRVSDLTTETRFHESLGDDVSTEYAGRIWTDKSVYSGDAVIELMSGKEVTVDNDSDFLVSFSALATSQSITGSSQAPVDVVFIIDTSGSMNDEMSSSDSTNRIVNTVAALNDAIDAIMDLNEYTRVGVVAFASNSEVLLPLGRYEKGSRTTGTGFNQQIITDYFSLSDDNGNLYVHAKKTGTSSSVTARRSVTGGTNIQRGIYEGMNMLATENSTSVDGVQRFPSVVLLSDGAPTYSVQNTTGTNWWNPDNNYSDGPGGSPYYGNGMKAIMTGAYMKEAINRNYGLDGTNVGTTMYTIGMGINGLSNSSGGWLPSYTGEQDLARITLAPYLYWNADNSMVTNIKSAWNTYITNDGDPRVQTNSNETYTFTHPSQHDIDTNPDALKNLVNGYYDADSASDVTQVFEQIVSEIAISRPEVPTELEHTDAMTTGYITYNDPLGEYMELKDVKGIIYKGVLYDSVTDNKDGTYTLSQTVETDLYGQQNLSGVLISVYTDDNGIENVKIQIPAALIPVRINTVELNENGSVKSHTNNGSFPMRVLYSVGLEEGLVEGSGADAYVLSEKISEEYRKENTVDGNINFYSNLYTGENVVNGHTAGNATVEFEPSDSNPFYYMQGDDPIYELVGGTYRQVSGTSADDLDDNTTYYYKDVFYHGASVQEKMLPRSAAQLKLVEIISIEGKLYRESGSPRLNRILEFEGTKTQNTTGTAEDFYAPTFVRDPQDPDPAAGKYVIYLGNNGVLSIASDGALEITKNVVVPEGLTPAVSEFEFTVDFNGSEKLDGNFNYSVLGTEKSGTVNDGGKLLLKDGETVKITGLPIGTTYTVTEKDYTSSGFTTVKTGDTGTVAAGGTSSAVFTNTYSVKEIQYPPTGDQGFTGKKVLDGRAWINGTDSYSFLITPYFNAPLPEGYNPDTGITVTSATQVDADTYEAGFDFGKITFTEPGVYRYTIVEREPATDTFLPGVTYSRALYRVVVTIVDDGVGSLSATADIQKLYTDDASQLFFYDENNQIVMNPGQEAQDEIVFTNTYEPHSVSRTPVALKTYIDQSGATRLLSHMFTFKLEALGYCVGDYNENSFVADQNIPMPAGTVNGAVTSTNEGTNVTFPSVVFTDADLRGQTKITYRYKLTEVAGTTAGMTYDSSEYYANVIISSDGTSDTLSVVAQYLDENGQDVRVVNFVNTFDPDDAKLTKSAGTALHGTKTITGRPFAADDDFRFTLTAENDLALEILPSAETKTMDGAVGQNESSFWFSDMTFTKVGEYKFSIKEEKGTLGGITYDADTTYVTVTVTLNEDEGKLEAGVIYANAENGASNAQAEFENIYTSTFTGTPVALTGTKTLTGKKLLASEFYFVVDQLDSTGKVIESSLVSNKADSNEDGVADINFLYNVSYDKAGTYTYLIYEQIPTIPVGGTDYDETVYRYTVVVTDDGKGNLSVGSEKLEVKAEGAADFTVTNAAIGFVNVYEPTPLILTIPTIRKVLAGNRRDPLQANEFEFELSLVSASPTDGILLPATTLVKNAADGSVIFGDLIFTKAGIYKVQIKEVIPVGVDEDPAKDGVQVGGVTYSTSAILATIHIADDRNGNLSVAVAENVGGTTITNVYESEGSVALTIEKNFAGREWFDTDSFEFEVIIEDPATKAAVESGAVVFPHDGDNIVNLTVDKDHKSVVSPEIEFYKPGVFKFLVHEIAGSIPGVHYDETRHEVVITVTDNNDGTLTVDTGLVDNKLVYNNVYDDKSVEISGHSYLAVKKQLLGRENDAWFETDKFVFTLSAADDLTRAAIAAGEIELPENADGMIVSTLNKEHAHFGNIVFNNKNASANENYKFVIKELSDAAEIEAATGSAVSSIPGVTYDSDSDRIISIHVESNGEGQLVATLVSSESEQISFTNTYSAEEVTLPAHANLVVTKELVGRDWFASDEFKFKLEAINGTVDAVTSGDVILPDSVKSTSITSSDAEHKDAFADDNNPDDGITFKKKGVYSFAITEVKENIKNISYDEHETIVTVTVEDDGNGNLVVAAVSYTGSMTFRNIYTPEAVIKTLEGRKTLNGNRTLSDGEFTFKITSVNGAPLPAKTEVKNTGSSVLFGAINYTKAGTYEYNITEVEGSIPGVTYDKGSVKAIVTVSYDSATGLLSAEASYSKIGALGSGFEFVNEYKAEKTDPISIGATKVVTPSAGNSFTLKANDFAFKISAAVNNPQPDPIANATVYNNAAGKVVFADAVSYTQPGTWVYTITELSGGKAGIDYDGSEYTVTIVVTDNRSLGKLQASVSVEKDGSAYTSGLSGILFDNGYDPKLTSVIISGKKILGGDHKTLENGEFTFKIEGKTATTPVPDTLTTTNDGSGDFAFGKIEYKVPGTFEYTVSEVDLGEKGYTYDTTTYPVTVVVTDENGELKATVTGMKDQNDEDIIVFTNTYLPASTTADISGKKTIVDESGKESLRKPGEKEFTFILLDKDGKEVKKTENKADGTFTFEDVAFDKAGDYTFTVIESASSITGITNDTTLFAVDVKVEDIGGELKASVSYPKEVVFKNVYKALPTSIRLNAIKKLSGRELAADEFTFELLDESGKVISTAKNTKDGVVLFDEIKFEKAGTYRYSIREVKGLAEYVTYDEKVHTVEVVVTDELKGTLTAKLSNEGAAVVFENTYSAPNPVIPSTGDGRNITLWITLCILSVLLGFTPVVLRKKRVHK